MTDFKLISSDSHMAEHPKAWERVQHEYGDRAPHIVEDPPELGKGLWDHRRWDTARPRRVLLPGPRRRQARGHYERERADGLRGVQEDHPGVQRDLPV